MARETTSELLTRLLDGGYNDAVETVVRAIGKNSAAVNERLKELQAEAQRLADAGETLTPSNPVFRALLAEVDDQMSASAGLIDDAGKKLVNAGVDAANELQPQLPLTFLDDGEDYRAAAQVVAKWNRVSTEAIDQIARLVNSPAWTAELRKFGDSVPQTILDIAVRGFTQGWNPTKTAALIFDTTNTLPLSYSNTLMRTLYLNAYRRGTTESYKANRDILEYAVRVATLDHRVCVACVLLHGTQIPLDEPVADHWNGRCTSVVKIKGIPLNIQTGKDWFMGLGGDEQAAMMGLSAYNAWQAGAIQLDQLVHTSEDDLFGPQVNVASLVSLLGAGASQWY